MGAKKTKVGIDFRHHLMYNFVIGCIPKKNTHREGITMMTENELELIRIIRENDCPEKAIMIATAIIIDFLKPHESSEGQAAACLPELS